MTNITIQPEVEQSYHFRAVSGSLHSVGKTAGEALDSLLSQEGVNIESSSILIQRFAPDAFFTQEQHDRMKDLLSHNGVLSEAENRELNELIDLELDATALRSKAIMSEAVR